MSVPANSLLDGFLENVQTTLDRSTLDKPSWVISNFRNPKDARKPWSFEDHEYQIEILGAGDTVHTVTGQKCAQVGFSTLEIIDTLTFAAIHDSLKAAYILPSAKFAQEFSQLRVDPIIVESPRIRSMLSGDTDNKSAKKIGSCFIVFRGTSGEAQAISIDLDLLVIDEVNFCNPKILSSFSSRLQHSDLKLRRMFSTPTLPGYGISKLVEQGSKGIYSVRCSHCNTVVFPDFFRDLRGVKLFKYLNQVEKQPTDLRPDDIAPLKDYLADHPTDVHLACEKCGRSLEPSLRDASRREWVHEHPERFREGNRSYYVRPFDVPKYNPTQEVLLSMGEYTYADFVNFRLGLPHESSDNSFMVEQIKRYCTIQQVPIQVLLSGSYRESLRGRRTFIGADLGKTNHVVIGIENYSGSLEIICCCTVDTAELRELFGEAHFGKWLEKLFVAITATKMVIDSAPSYEPALYTFSRLPLNTSFGAYYVQRTPGKTDIYDFKENQGSANICRTEHFDELASVMNAGNILLPTDSETKGVLNHLGNFKKIKVTNSKGVVTEIWQNTGGPDHYTHAIGYLWAAYSSTAKRNRGGGGNVVPFPTISTVRMK